MSIIEYNGKLNDHKEYIKMLNKIELKCKYIEIVIIDGRKSNELVDEFSNDIIEVKKISKWWGTQIEGVNNLYKIKATKEFFIYLTKYETFCKYHQSKNRGDYVEITDFGYDDIAFYDENNNYILFTTTHEGDIVINDEINK